MNKAEIIDLELACAVRVIPLDKVAVSPTAARWLQRRSRVSDALALRYLTALETARAAGRLR